MKRVFFLQEFFQNQSQIKKNDQRSACSEQSRQGKIGEYFHPIMLRIIIHYDEISFHWTFFEDEDIERYSKCMKIKKK